MELSEYQGMSRSTAIYPGMGQDLIYPTLGLCGEAGEVAEKVKKLIRDHAGIRSDQFVDLLSKELGDVLWYLAAIATELGLDLDDIAYQNLNKLRERQQKNMLKGVGDEREKDAPIPPQISPKIYTFESKLD